jgi:hypothetical protein
MAYGFAVDITADVDGLPLTRVSKKRATKSFGLTVRVVIWGLIEMMPAILAMQLSCSWL